MKNKVDDQNENKKRTEISKSRDRGNGVKWTDKVMVVISAILAFYTFKLFSTASEQTKITIKATDAAIKATSISETNSRRDSINNILARENDRWNKMRDNISLDEQKKSIDAQIKSIQESQKQFNIQNEPFLEIGVLKNTIEKNKLTIVLAIRNLGRYPVKVYDGKINFKIQEKIPRLEDIHTIEIIGDNDGMRNGGRYLTSEKPIEYTYTCNVTNKEIDECKEGFKLFWITGFFKYTNLLTMRDKEYKYILSIQDEEITYFHNNSTPIN